MYPPYDAPKIQFNFHSLLHFPTFFFFSVHLVFQISCTATKLGKRNMESNHGKVRTVVGSRCGLFTAFLWHHRMSNESTDSEGQHSELPVEVLLLLSGEELREMMYGNPDLDVDVLKQVVEYESYSAIEARKQFLQFVWARNHLPQRESDFDAPFKIQKDKPKRSRRCPALPRVSSHCHSWTAA